MKQKVFFSALTVIFLFLCATAYSQDYDLIVSSQGDSIACHIDSITDTHIYFEMRSQNNWAQTHIGLTEVIEYKRDAIFKEEFLFKTGTSIIKSPKPDLPTSIRSIQKNSVYMGILSISYARMFPAGDRVGFTMGGGLYHFDATGLVGEISVLMGGVRHYFETGIMGVYFFDSNSVPEEDPIYNAASIRAGYRYQGPGGLLIRAAPNVVYYDSHVSLVPALSVGYSF